MKTVCLLLMLVFNAILLRAQVVTQTYCTETENWEQSSNLKVEKWKKNIAVDMNLFPGNKLQKIDGFGGCFNELGWEALLSLSPSDRDKIMKELFSPNNSNFSHCRMPIGASDYALSWYSHDEVPEDFSMRNFNIDRDRYILIPYIKEAQKIHPGLKIWASPWSPPTWMKVNNHYALTSGGVKGQKKGDNEMGAGKNIGNNSTAFKMENAYLEAYALYLSKFVKAYQQEGIDINAIHVQNEIAYAPQWPSCTWRPEDLAFFIKKYLGPKFKEDSIKTGIWLGTINQGNPDYVRIILKDKEAASYIKGVGFQWGGKNAIPAINKEYPDLRLMQTESECGEGENNWKSAENTWKLINHYLSNGASSYIYWNMVLDNTGESRWGWPQNMLISINKKTKEVRYTPEFYLMKLLSHFVLPGAHRIETSGGKDHLAFMNPDNQIILLIANTDETDKKVTVRVNDKIISVSIKGKSFNSLAWEQNQTKN